MDEIRVTGGPLDGERTAHIGDQFIHRIGDTIHVYELWPGEETGQRYYHAAALVIGSERRGPWTT